MCTAQVAIIITEFRCRRRGGFVLLLAAGAAFALGAGSTAASASTAAPSLRSVIASSARPAAERARDRYRHPLQTLRFFGVKPDQTVVEIWPAPGYYTAILAPYLRAQGHYIAAGFPTTDADVPQWRKTAMQKYAARFDADPARYGPFNIIQFGLHHHWRLAAPGTVDRVLTFRNVHNWVQNGFQQQAFDAFFKALKPGGILGVVEHHGWKGETVEQIKHSGYVPEAYVKALAVNAGFRFAASSPVNANPKDDHHHPEGVWTLPPTYRLGKKDHAKYAAIGESDRMTLKFVKPAG